MDVVIPLATENGNQPFWPSGLQTSQGIMATMCEERWRRPLRGPGHSTTNRNYQAQPKPNRAYSTDIASCHRFH